MAIDFSKVKILSPNEVEEREHQLKKDLAKFFLENLQKAGFTNMSEKDLSVSRDRITFKTPTVRNTILNSEEESIQHLDIMAQGRIDLAYHSTSQGFFEITLLAIMGKEGEKYHEVSFPPARQINGNLVDITKPTPPTFSAIAEILKTAEKKDFDLLVKTMNQVPKGNLAPPKTRETAGPTLE